ncbi:phage holin family protein [Mycolicibacterium sp.]|jgi:hypothetical protein|uniref:phage holin family protein n=1 Tax=Mycolicibacterium sp. TaxID=2320850 RepID=UPI0028B0168B|nr:phage holin family protein [Mycolicibacterium sp.]
MNVEPEPPVGTTVAPPGPRPAPPAAEASVGELLTRLSTQTSRLVRDEMQLAQNEIRDSVRHAVKGAGLISAAGVVAFLAAATLVAAAVAGLSEVLPVWAAALIIGAVLLAGAGIAAMLSRREAERATPAVPQTKASVRRDFNELKGATHARHVTR